MKNHFAHSHLVVALAFFSVVVLVSPSTLPGIGLTVLIGLLCYIISERQYCKWTVGSIKLSKKQKTYSLELAVLSTLFLFIEFVNRWLSSSKVRYIADNLHTSSHLFLIMIGLLASIGTVLFFFVLFQNVANRINEGSFQSGILCIKPENNLRQADVLPFDRVIILICAVCSVTICSRSSPLYPFNNWDDANCFFTVGKSMFNGLVPYRDLLEQKGPLLYFLYGLAWCISNDTFLGGYVLEIIAGYFYLLYSYRITLLFLRKRCLISVPVIALLTYTSWAFDRGGSAEELCLPLLSLSLWIIIQGAINEHYSKNKLLLFGFAAGCVFWIKFTLVGLYIGWFIWFLYDCAKNGQKKQIIYALILIVIGVLLSTLPWLIYFGMNDAIKDWLMVYVYDNLFVYTQRDPNARGISTIPIIGGIVGGVKTWYLASTILLYCCSAILLYLLLHHRNRAAQLLITTMISAFFFIYAGGRHYRYYSLLMAIFLAPAFAILLSTVLRKATVLCKPIFLTAVVALCFLGLFTTPNRYFMSFEKSDLAQYQFRDIIARDDSEATILNYGFLDGGFYTVCNQIPTCKAFCGLNLKLDELAKLQNYYTENGLCDYIITRTEVGADEKREFPLYECIAERDSDDFWGEQTYRLYKITEKTDP